jgi:hypothetical protein
MKNEYAYQIQGALEDKKQNVLGFRVFLWTTNNFYEVDVPGNIFGREILDYMKFRMSLTSVLQIQGLPDQIQEQIREPMGEYLNDWVRGRQSRAD